MESLAFAYDAANRITGITNGGSASLSQTLGYDALNRLTSMASTADHESYQYDADGNRTSQVVNGVATSFAYPSNSNRLASVSGGLNATYGYNADGDTKTIDGHMAYTYGPFGYLMNAGGTAFAISAEGQRLEKSGAAGTTYFAPDASGPLLAEDLNGTWRDYVWLNGRLVTVVANGGVYPVASDQTGRPLALTHPATKAILWESENLPFDRDTIVNGWGAFEIGFPGQYWDTEDNLWHNGARDYDPTLGRYIESDPIGLAGGVNTYAYVGNNPISNVDPLGLCDKPKCTAWQQSLAALADGADQLASATSTGAAELGLGAFGIEVSGLGPEDPFADAAAGVAASGAALAGTASVGMSVTAGALRMEASGGNFNYLGRAIAVSTLGKIGSLLMKVPGLGEPVGYGIEKVVDYVAPPLPPPCAGSP